MCWTDDKGQFAAVHTCSRIYVFHFKPALPVSVYFVSLPTLRVPVETLSTPWCWGSCPLSSPGFWGLCYGYVAQVRVRWCQNCSTGWELSRVVVPKQLCSAPCAASVHSFYPSFPVLQHSSLPRTLSGVLILVAGTYETGSCMPCSPFPSM